MLIAPVDVKLACPFSIEILANCSGLKFQYAVAFLIPKSEMVASFARFPVSVLIYVPYCFKLTKVRFKFYKRCY